jgi:hypothetical protein
MEKKLLVCIDESLLEKNLFHFTRCFSFEAHAQTAYCNFRHLFLECARLLVSVDPSGALSVFLLSQTSLPESGSILSWVVRRVFRLVDDK